MALALGHHALQDTIPWCPQTTLYTSGLTLKSFGR